MAQFTAKYLGDATHPEWLALGDTKAEIEQRAIQAGINPVNLQWTETPTSPAITPTQPIQQPTQQAVQQPAQPTQPTQQVGQLPPKTQEPTTTPTGTSTLKAYDAQGNVVYVESDKYYPGISPTPPAGITAPTPPSWVDVNKIDPKTGVHTDLQKWADIDPESFDKWADQQTKPPYGTTDAGLQKWANENPEAFDLWADKQKWFTAPVSTYTGVSIVDYLKSTGQPSDFASRAVLAQQQGIQNYTGTAEQNTQMLKQLRTGAQASPPGAPGEVATSMIKEPEEIPEEPTEDKLTLDDIFKQFGLTPAVSLEDVIKQVSTAFGMESINKEMEKLDNEYANTIAEINVNPWLTESVRSRKVAMEQAKYESKKTALVNRLRLQGDIVGTAIKLFESEREYKKDMLFKAMDLRESQIREERLTEGQRFQEEKFYTQEARLAEGQRLQEIGLATTSDIKEYQFAVEQGYTGSFMDYQALQKATIRRTGGGGGGTPSGTPITGLTTKETTAFWSAIDRGKNELQQGEPWGNVWNRIKAQFPKASNEDIDNGLGVRWKEPGAYQEWAASKKVTTSGSTSKTADDFYNSL